MFPERLVAPSQAARIAQLRRFCLSYENFEQLARTGLRGRMHDLPAPEASDEEEVSLEYVESVADNIREVPPAPPEAAGQVDDELTFYSEEVGFGNMSIRDAVDAFFDSATNILG